MFPPSFDYHRASSVSEALSLLAELPDATLLAGGHALLPRLKNGRAEPGAVVDVSELPELIGVDVGSEATVVGAATTYATLLETGTEAGDADEESDAGGSVGDPTAGRSVLEQHAPAFLEATRAVGDRQIRNRGTVGGNLAEAHPESDLPAAALVADASVRIRGSGGEREVAVEEFLTGAFESAVGDDEIVTAVRIPHVDGWDGSNGGDAEENGSDRNEPTVDNGGAYVRKTHPTSGYAMVGVAVRVGIDDGVIASARVAANGVADTALRLSSVETALEGIDVTTEGVGERVTAAVENAPADVPEATRRGDVHASAEYRVSVLPTYVERAVRAAVDSTEAGSDGGPDSVGDSAPDSDSGRNGRRDQQGGEPR
ncbi:xanthine dehydrogenase family protein subunit M [Natronorubrum sp. JWXQ-INN-674]|uniref:Xanthine dehydrogenase family protein subunit M n=1 Tax=Natronorubrum halalkaliphilum TaxID=2691917 RepID=A0A6B0VJB5_9EURY|nr:xanthine dehydrogenase family protein subunit M [Natronorubrum halalkaliphilum]MXV61931.1 xanthine dehydrogenase family protein subunit M [Natronorubrum halalkaliphilum]